MIDPNRELMSIEALHFFQDDLLKPTLLSSGEIVSEIEVTFEKPKPTSLGGHPVWRYENPKVEHIIIQRLYRQISGLKSCYTLLRQGQIQEIGVLLRTVNEFQQDITFLLENYGKEMSGHQKLFVTEVLKEGYVNINLPWLGATPRAMVSRKKIIASVARALEAQANPSDAQKLSELDTDIFSSFVHGAYPAVMDIYGHNPRNPSYHAFGVITPRIIFTWVTQIIVYLERLILSQFFVCHNFGLVRTVNKVLALRKKFTEEAKKYGHDLSLMDKGSMDRLKKGKPIENPEKVKSKAYGKK
jgi:hypothetical protein